MNINLNTVELISILKAVHSEFVSSKMYFKEHKSDFERIGITPPEEYRELYNNILNQAHSNGELLELNLIDM